MMQSRIGSKIVTMRLFGLLLVLVVLLTVVSGQKSNIHTLSITGSLPSRSCRPGYVRTKSGDCRRSIAIKVKKLFYFQELGLNYPYLNTPIHESFIFIFYI
jgi:hypothetical protein